MSLFFSCHFYLFRPFGLTYYILLRQGTIYHENLLYPRTI